MEYSKAGLTKKTSSDRISAYRLVAPRWASTALSGEGARKFGGRWNTPGRPVVYLGQSRSLTALELLVHLTTPSSRKKHYTLLEVSFPANCVQKGTLFSEDWKTSPPTRASTQVGDEWLQQQDSLALRVPSSLVEEESVILLNPLHPDFSKVQTLTSRKFCYDERLSE